MSSLRDMMELYMMDGLTLLQFARCIKQMGFSKLVRRVLLEWAIEKSREKKQDKT